MPHPKTIPADKPTVLTPEVQAKFIDAIRRGNYLIPALNIAGLDRRVYYWWKDKVESGDPVADKFVDFFIKVQTAMSEVEDQDLQRIREGSPGWQSSAWFLERRFSGRWSRKERIVFQKPPKPLEQMTDDELEEYRKRLARNRRNRD